MEFRNEKELVQQLRVNAFKNFAEIRTEKSPPKYL